MAVRFGKEQEEFEDKHEKFSFEEAIQLSIEEKGTKWLPVRCEDKAISWVCGFLLDGRPYYYLKKPNYVGQLNDPYSIIEPVLKQHQWRRQGHLYYFS